MEAPGTMSMETRILLHLEKNGSITSWFAIKEFGCTRLSQYILLLRRRNLNITDTWEHTKNRYGQPVKYKKYILEK